MAAFKWYGPALVALANGDLDFDTDSFKVALTTDAHTPNQDTHNFRDDLTNEVSGTGYTAGGLALAGVSVVYDAASNSLLILWSDSVWSGASFTARNAHIYKVVGSAATDPLIAFLTFDANATVSASTFTLDYTTSTLKLIAA